ncbi:ATP-dependent helicase [Vibrio parahaemolyticus]|uniref:UvrD-helicase domain-containing protein n=1 Tax=Vibrio parahaemolyticus TaxID=670 RepID=UPI00084AFBF7|nr:ATP-dependent helicase [Vibrio parahaemolyticus]EGQ9826763.1 ATP-dependent helicase [Vibrio parahaemolyticus]EHR6657885.1 ATP-dependent helicase [Vibrio parahaemolyticus]EJG2056955.1 ATP-dependent helicase [Vibrio parahaemolyticus]EJG2058182.1 ATP-dependent helicase [Vibrio parahaemolyticus]ODW22904.1 helicase [Vibrio parahaemolyticus]
MTEWKPSEGIKYTDELKEIITADTSVAVLAGAGSGKTELLAQKADYLFTTARCAWPKRILSLTFKREAQFNIRKRVELRCGINASRFDSFTFHAFSKSIVDRFKNLLPEDIRPIDNYDLVDKAKDANGKSKLSMEQLIKLSIKIVHDNEKIKKLFTDSYEYVFADEFQDTTDQQYELIKSIFQGSTSKILSVGDINQSIMLWAGARKTVFEDYIKDFGAEYKFLVTNHRSSKDINDVLSTFLKYIKREGDIQVNSDASTGCYISVYKDEYQEARYISEKIQSLISAGLPESEICIVTKQQSSLYSQIIRDELGKMSINNLDMSDLQDSLKEPVGEFFILYMKSLFLPMPKHTTKLYELYLTLNNVELNEDKEEEYSVLFYSYLEEQKKIIDSLGDADSLISNIQKFFKFLGLDKIKSKWKQYKSGNFLESLWVTLETHLRDVFSKTSSPVEGVKLFTADNAVQIMNIHKCKGLEYESVFFVGLEDQAFWNYKNAEFENDCAIYVAMSRAKESLEITFSLHREHRINQYYDNRSSSCTTLKGVYDALISNCRLPLIDMTAEV